MKSDNNMYTQSKLENKANTYRWLSKIYMIVITIFLIAAIYMMPNRPTGEALSFIPPTISILQGDWYIATPRALETAIQEMPDFAWHIIEEGDTRYGTELQDGGFIPAYFPTYSMICIPARLVLKVLGLNQSYMFRITNILLFAGALFFVYMKLDISEKSKFYLLLLLSINPIIYYVLWTSFEVCIWFFIILSMVLWWRGSYKLSALFLSIASTMNSTVLVFGIFMIIYYFVELYRNARNEDKKIFRLLSMNFKDIALYAFSFTPFLLPYMNNILVERTMGAKPLDIINITAQSQWYLDRLTAYLFDLNFGFLPYVPILLLMFFGILLYTVFHIKEEYRFLLSSLGFLAVLLGYTVTFHINCGMTGIARYNAWAMPMMIFTIIMLVEKHFAKISKYVRILFPISIICTVFVLTGTFMHPARGSGPRFSFIAEFVLDRAPSLYNPYYATFHSRTKEIDGGYTVTEPVFYVNKEGYVRKILVLGNEQDKEYIRNNITPSTADDRNYIENQLSQIKNNNKFQYINVPHPYEIYYLQSLHLP